MAAEQSIDGEETVWWDGMGRRVFVEMEEWRRGNQYVQCAREGYPPSSLGTVAAVHIAAPCPSGTSTTASARRS